MVLSFEIQTYALYVHGTFVTVVFPDGDPQMINKPHVTYSVRFAPGKNGVAEKQYCLLGFVCIKMATAALF